MVQAFPFVTTRRHVGFSMSSYELTKPSRLLLVSLARADRPSPVCREQVPNLVER